MQQYDSTKITHDLVRVAELYGTDATRKLERTDRARMGQFLTLGPVAGFMARLFREPGDRVNLLDPGAGVGSLTAAFVEQMLAAGKSPTIIQVDTYEIDSVMQGYLDSTLVQCEKVCLQHGVSFAARVIKEDFIEYTTELLKTRKQLFAGDIPQYTHCIMNPPYRKIRSDSNHREWLRQIGIETSNLYSAFLAIAIMLLTPGGELVAIIPRSFCNGVYFRPFRQFLLSNMTLKHIHVFDQRDQAFKDDEVLQENIIIYAVKGVPTDNVVITSSNDPSWEGMTQRQVPFDKVVKPGDSDQYIHLALTDFDQMIVDQMSLFTHSLEDIGLDVCTGPVVDFRLRDYIKQQPEDGGFPLIYPAHFAGNLVRWPNPRGRKPNTIIGSEESRKWLMPNGWYVLTRRFSSKEERRRIVAAVYDPEQVLGEMVGFENHLNVFHHKREGLQSTVAKGLAIFLNSTLVDLYFRQFSGHTQVNAADLRTLHYPSIGILTWLGRRFEDVDFRQSDIDSLLEAVINEMPTETQPNTNPVQIEKRIQETRSVLKAIGMPKAQNNNRSALTLLALLGLRPENTWQEAEGPLMGITPIMDFVRDHYGVTYAPNTRETFRRQTMHQFMDAGVVVANPDDPSRPTNSPYWVYQIDRDVLELVRVFGLPAWEERLAAYLGQRKTLAERYANERDMRMIPLTIGQNQQIFLTAGEHSQLIKDIIEQFGPRFTPGAEVLYVGDTGAKMGCFEQGAFEELGLVFDRHGKFPDVVLYYREKSWLLLIEAVTSHGPVDAKRHSELSSLFASAKAGLVYVTAFPSRQVMAKYLAEISWETEVWVADSPTHLIHFDGEKFLGPYGGE